MENRSKKVQLFTDTHQWCKVATEILRQYFPGGVDVIEGGKSEKLSDDVGCQEYDLTISFLSPFVIPQKILDNSKLAVNFHPGNRYFPGAGCYSFALYQDAEEYGVVCHHMRAKVDTGPIITEENFPIFPEDSVETLQLRSYVALLGMFQKFLDGFLAGEDFLENNFPWESKPYSKAQLNEMQILGNDLSEKEIARRVRAFDYPGYPLLVESDGKKFSRCTDHTTPLTTRILKQPALPK